MTSAKPLSLCSHCQLSEGTPEWMRDTLVSKGRAAARLSPRPCSSTTPMAPRLSRLGLALIPTRRGCLSTQLTTASAAENKRCQILPEELSHGWRPRGQFSRQVGSKPGQRDQGLQRSCCLEGEGWSGLFSIMVRGAWETGSCRRRSFPAAGSRSISDLDIRMVSNRRSAQWLP